MISRVKVFTFVTHQFISASTNDLNEVDENGVLVLQKGIAKPLFDKAKHGQRREGIPCEVEKVLGVDLDNVIEAELKPHESPKLQNTQKRRSDSLAQSYTVSLMCNNCDFDTSSAEVLERHSRTAHGPVCTDTSTSNREGGLDREDAEMFKSTEEPQKATKFSLRRSFRKRTQNQGESVQAFMEDLQRLAMSCGFCRDRDACFVLS